MDKIYWYWRRDLRGADGLKPMIDYRSALLAVMELHKPIIAPFDEYIEPICVPCDTDYPCSTVQAIEKELNK